MAGKVEQSQFAFAPSVPTFGAPASGVLDDDSDDSVQKPTVQSGPTLVPQPKRPPIRYKSYNGL